MAFYPSISCSSILSHHWVVHNLINWSQSTLKETNSCDTRSSRYWNWMKLKTRFSLTFRSRNGIEAKKAKVHRPPNDEKEHENVAFDVLRTVTLFQERGGQSTLLCIVKVFNVKMHMQFRSLVLFSLSSLHVFSFQLTKAFLTNERDRNMRIKFHVANFRAKWLAKCLPFMSH